MSTPAIPDRFTTLPDEPRAAATVVFFFFEIEEHGFSVEVRLVISMRARRACPHSGRLAGDDQRSVTLAETGIDATRQRWRGPMEPGRTKCFALDIRDPGQEIKAIGGQNEMRASVTRGTRDGTLGHRVASAASSPPTLGARAKSSSSSVRRTLFAYAGGGARADLSAQPALEDARAQAPTGSTARSGRSSRSTRMPGPHPHRPHPPAGRL